MKFIVFVFSCGFPLFCREIFLYNQDIILIENGDRNE